jgi:hypothetical protein
VTSPWVEARLVVMRPYLDRLVRAGRSGVAVNRSLLSPGRVETLHSPALGTRSRALSGGSPSRGQPAILCCRKAVDS